MESSNIFNENLDELFNYFDKIEYDDLKKYLINQILKNIIDHQDLDKVIDKILPFLTEQYKYILPDNYFNENKKYSSNVLLDALLFKCINKTNKSLLPHLSIIFNYGHKIYINYIFYITKQDNCDREIILRHKFDFIKGLSCDYSFDDIKNNKFYEILSKISEHKFNIFDNILRSLPELYPDNIITLFNFMHRY